MPDYTALANTALRLVRDAGRECTFVQYNQTPADTAAPWQGPADPRSSPLLSKKLHAVEVDVGTLRRLGMGTLSEDLVKRTDQFFIVAPGPDFKGDLRKIHEMIDEATRWSVLEVGTLKPGLVTLLHYVAAKR